jgi:hypothetical protein
MSSATVKPMPATAAAPVSCGQATVRGAPEAGREPGRAEDAHDLADDETGDDPRGDGRFRRAFDDVAVDLDSRVRKREERHDDEARPRMEQVLEALIGRDGGSHRPARGPGQLGDRFLAEEAPH